MKTIRDQLGIEITLQASPKRIISLVPSQTELLFDLGKADQIIAITTFCIHPKDACRQKVKIGGTKKFDIDTIKSLNPDLIIANKEENYLEGINKLRSIAPVWTSDITTLEDAYQMIRSIGELTSAEHIATNLLNRISEQFATLPEVDPSVTVAYLIWKKPWMCAGNDTFINDMLHRCGWRNAFGHLSRYPELSEEQLQNCKADYIFLSSEPYPFKKRHIKELHDLCPASKIVTVDGEMFSWYGSRLLYAPQYFANLKNLMQ